MKVTVEQLKDQLEVAANISLDLLHGRMQSNAIKTMREDEWGEDYQKSKTHTIFKNGVDITMESTISVKDNSVTILAKMIGKNDIQIKFDLDNNFSKSVANSLLMIYKTFDIMDTMTEPMFQYAE